MAQVVARMRPAQLAEIDAMEENLASGSLGRTDGWSAADITGMSWDPTAAP
jgi:hypothetical protein